MHTPDYSYPLVPQDFLRPPLFWYCFSGPANSKQIGFVRNPESYQKGFGLFVFRQGLGAGLQKNVHETMAAFVARARDVAHDLD
jgi:hypothetical protein